MPDLSGYCAGRTEVQDSPGPLENVRARDYKFWKQGPSWRPPPEPSSSSIAIRRHVNCLRGCFSVSDIACERHRRATKRSHKPRESSRSSRSSTSRYRESPGTSSAASSRAIPRPIPLPPPVTSATMPFIGAMPPQALIESAGSDSNGSKRPVEGAKSTPNVCS